MCGGRLHGGGTAFFSRMYYIAGKDLSYSFVSRTDPSKLSEGDIIYRNLAYDKSLKMYVVSDFLPYGDGKVLCLIYPFECISAYSNTAQRGHVFDSCGPVKYLNTEGERIDPSVMRSEVNYDYQEREFQDSVPDSKLNFVKDC